MARVGLVGGLGPQATLDYYRRLIKAWECEDPLSSPLIVIDSVDNKIALRLAEHDRPRLTEYILESLHRLHGAGAHFGAITSNMSHLVFDRVVKRSPIPLISIVDVCMAEARRLGLKRLALFGTRFVMEARLYPAAAQPHGIQIVVPPEADRTWMHERYVGELVKGDFRDETRRGVVAMAERLREAKGIDGIILGGTELPLLMTAPTIADLPVLDTTGLHVAAILERLRAYQSTS
ncbi:MAG TPA: amino acid racemase [Gemmatimonadaceae bacterium]|nr:amino acid racemase [Gemmatimonadaceae bacterium]